MSSREHRYDVFLSHNSADKPAVQVLADQLRAAGLDPFLDTWHLIPGTPWQEGIEQALEESASVAVFVGPSGISPWHNEEMRDALDRAVRSRDDYRVIPVLLPGADESSISRFLARRVWVDFRGGLDDDAALQRLVAGVKGEAVEVGSYGLPDDPAPYRGLLPFEAEHARFFFGREADIQRLVARMTQQPFVAVVGASGSGKSSLVKAGLLPRLGQNALPNSNRWRVLSLTPGSQPLRSLASQLAMLAPTGADRLKAADTLTERLQTSDDGLRTAVAAYQADAAGLVFLLVDQFEELFTLCQEGPERCRTQAEHFVANLVNAVQHGNDQVRVLITLRADFLDRCLALSDLRGLLEDRQLLLGPMDEPALREAIAKPAQAVGALFEKGLVEIVLRDVGAEPGMLPLLQQALYELWLRRRGPWLTLAAYQQSGGVLGALQKRADDTYHSLTSEQQEIARSIFLRLTTLGEGIPNTRRRVRREEIYPANRDRSEVDTVIQTLSSSQARLIVADENAAEVAHEALILQWPSLRHWLEDDREAFRIHRHLTESAEEWDTLGRESSVLYRGARLTQINEWAKTNHGKLNKLEREFLDASRKTATRAAQIRAGLWTAFVLLILALGVVYGMSQKRLVEQERTAAATAESLAATALAEARTAKSRELAAAAQYLKGTHLDLALLLAVEAARIEETTQARDSLLATLLQRPEAIRFLRATGAESIAVALSPDGNRLATGHKDGTILLWDVAAGMVAAEYHPPNQDPVTDLAFLPTENALAYVMSTGRVGLLDQGSGLPRWESAIPGATAFGVAASPDGTRLATDGKSLYLWDSVSGEVVGNALGQADPDFYAMGVAFSADGRHLAAGNVSKGVVTLWSIETQTPERTLNTNLPPGARISLAFAQDSKLAVSGDNGISIWDADSGALLSGPTGPDLSADIGFSADGRTVVANSFMSPSTLNVLRIADAQVEVEDLEGQAAEISDLDLAADGSLAATVGKDAIVLWNISNTRTGQRTLGNTVTLSGKPATAAALRTDGHFAVVGHENGQATLVTDVGSSTRRSTVVDFGDGDVMSLAFDPSRSLLAAGMRDGTVAVIDLTTNAPRFSVAGHIGGVGALAFNANGEILASGGDDSAIRFWNTRDGTPVRPSLARTFNQAPIAALAFSADGRTLAALSAISLDQIDIWDISGDARLAETLDMPAGIGTALAYDQIVPNLRLAAMTTGGVLSIWGVSEGTPLVLQSRTPPTAYARIIVFSPDGNLIVTGDINGDVRIWEAATGQMVGMPIPGTGGAVNDIEFLDQGGQLVLAVIRGRELNLWPFGRDAWIADACRLANRALTPDEWERYLGLDTPYQPGCQVSDVGPKW